MAAHPISRTLLRITTQQANQISLPLSHHLKPNSLPNSWLVGHRVSLHSSFSTPKPLQRPHRPITATISFSLPTAWSRRAIKSFAMGELEARKLKYPNTGTEALLMGILVEGTNLAAKFLRANGITLLKVQEETVKLLGKGDMYFFSPEHPPLTEAAQRALDWAVDEKIRSGEGGEITTTHLLLGIWSEKDSPGYKILATLGFNDEKAEKLKSLSSKPGSEEDP
ncbi:Clp, repeat (R) domain [Dillenia turbinata]|uniref:Clp, repeat (R) domain n=1 Tax=Dillenia turbinata TaxID=194707 RepID=A0AAN8W7N1_9MAGN